MSQQPKIKPQTEKPNEAKPNGPESAARPRKRDLRSYYSITPWGRRKPVAG